MVSDRRDEQVCPATWLRWTDGRPMTCVLVAHHEGWHNDPNGAWWCPGGPGTVPWRVGRSLGRTVYARVGDESSKDDILLGMMDTAALAALVCADHNACLPDEPVS